MNDLISRQEAIRVIYEIANDETANKNGWVDPYYIINRVEYMPSAEQIIHCKDCKYWNKRSPVCNKTKKFGYGVNDYCSKAQLREDD